MRNHYYYYATTPTATATPMRGGGGANRNYHPLFASSLSFTDVFVLALLVVILLTYLRHHYGEVEYVKSRVDGRKYLVRKLPDRKKAADTLARINIELTRLVEHLTEKYGTDDPRIKRLRVNYNPDNVSEGGLEHGYTSYSVNKGEKIVLCIRQDDNSFVPPNVLLYVSIHELAHLATKSIGHESPFWANFRWMLKEAIAIGVYERVDYAEEPQRYCGIRISSSVV